MRGNNLILRRYIENYGYDFVIEAVEKAIALKNAREMVRKETEALPSVGKKEGEYRILELANKMKIRIGGASNVRRV